MTCKIYSLALAYVPGHISYHSPLLTPFQLLGLCLLCKVCSCLGVFAVDLPSARKAPPAPPRPADRHMTGSQ